MDLLGNFEVSNITMPMYPEELLSFKSGFFSLDRLYNSSNNNKHLNSHALLSGRRRKEPFTPAKECYLGNDRARQEDLGSFKCINALKYSLEQGTKVGAHLNLVLVDLRSNIAARGRVDGIPTLYLRHEKS